MVILAITLLSHIYIYIYDIYIYTHTHLAFPFTSLLPTKINCQISSRINSVLFYSKFCPKFVLKKNAWGVPGGAVVGNLPANAGDTGSSPGLGRSHMPRSSWAREPQLLSLRLWGLCSATREAAAVRGLCTAMRSGPHLPQLEKALAQRQRPNTAINK